MSLWPINFLQLVCTIYVSAFYGYLIYKNFFYFKILWVSCLDPDAARLDRIKVISLVLFYIALTLTIVSCSDTEQSTVTAHERKFFIGMMIVTAGTYIYPNVLCPTLMVGMAGFTVYRNIMNVHVVHFDDDIPLADRGTAKGHSTPALKYPAASPSAIASTPEQASPSAIASTPGQAAPTAAAADSILHKIHESLFNRNNVNPPYQKIQITVQDQPIATQIDFFKIQLKTGTIVTTATPEQLDMNRLYEMEQLNRLNFKYILDFSALVTGGEEQVKNPVDIYRRAMLIQELQNNKTSIDLINMEPNELFRMCNHDRVAEAWAQFWASLRK